jgi:hypothetical protein
MSVLNGWSNRTILPRASPARRSSSWKLLTTSTGAVMPSGGVPTLIPSPSMLSGATRGDVSVADSSPRTQCGTIAGSPCTLSSPSFRISPRIQSIARSSDADPLKRWPKVSVSVASRV